jgi:hypothetical protein
MQSLYRHLDWKRMQKFLMTELPNPIQWKFSSPVAPHMGGAWERLVRSIKLALKAVIRNRRVTLEEFRTQLCQAEAVVNGRPLTMVTLDTGDPLPLSPFHLQNGRSLQQIPDFLAKDQWNQPLAIKWRERQRLKTSFWNQWIKIYLKTLMCSKKWHLPQDAPKVGQIVILNDGSTSRSQWPLARVEAVVTGRDRLVRSVDLKRCGTDTVIRRAIHYVHKFEAEDDAEIPQTAAVLEIYFAVFVGKEETAGEGINENAVAPVGDPSHL